MQRIYMNIPICPIPFQLFIASQFNCDLHLKYETSKSSKELVYKVNFKFELSLVVV